MNVPSDALPSSRPTLPVGVAPVPDTVTVIVTCAPAIAGFGEAVTVIVGVPFGAVRAIELFEALGR